MKPLYALLIMALPLHSFGQDSVRAEPRTIESTPTFKMYPNPAYGNQVYISTALPGEKIVKIFDIFGEPVLSEEVKAHSLDISKLDPGVYVIQVTQGERSMTRKLVVK